MKKMCLKFLGVSAVGIWSILCFAQNTFGVPAPIGQNPANLNAPFPAGNVPFPTGNPNSGPLPGQPALPAATFGNFSFTEREASFRSASETQRLFARLGYSSTTRARVNVDYATLVGEQWAFGANLVAGERESYRELMLNALYSPLKDLHFRLSAGQLSSSNPYAFFSGTQDVTVRQNSSLFGIKKTFDKTSILSDIGLTAYGAKALQPKTSETLMVNETANITEIMVDPRKITTGTLMGSAFSVGLFPIPSAKLDLSLGYEQLDYRYFDGTRNLDTRVASSARYTQSFENCLRMQVGLASGVASNRFDLAFLKNFWSISYARVLGRDNNPSDTRVMVGYQVPLGGGSSACKTADLNIRPQFSRLDDVIVRPSQLPTVVLAKVDTTAKPYLLARFDKSQLNGATVQATTDSVLIGLNNSVISIPVIMVNGNPTANVGPNGAPLLTFEGNTVRVLLNNFNNPGSGVIQSYEAVVALSGGWIAQVKFNVVGR